MATRFLTMRRASNDELEPFHGIPTPYISDALSRLCGVTGLRRYGTATKLVGYALTVKTRPGDNLMVHKALDLSNRCDVLVIDGGGDCNNALVGELMMLYARSRGVSGFVVDGAIRDISAFATFPCYARGHTHRGPYKEGPGEINVPVSVGGSVIMPGDVVVGDEDGVIAFAPDLIPEIVAAARAQAAKEENTKRSIMNGSMDRSWVNELLRQKGIAIP